MRITHFVVFVSLLLTCVRAHAQGTLADYERADTLPGDWAKLVRNDEIRVRWLTPDHPVFQYDLPDGSSEWRTVDLETGTITPALEMEMIAGQLTALGIEEQPRITWFDAIEPGDDGVRIVFTLAAQPGLWAMQTDGSDLKRLAPNEIPSGLGMERARIDRSQGGGPRTSVFVLNAYDETVEFQWVDSSGDHKTYATLEPGESHRQGTYTNHAWRIVSASGKTLGVYLASEDPGVIIVTEPGGDEGVEAHEQPTYNRNASPDGRYRVRFDDAQVVLVDRDSDTRTKLTEDASADKIDYSGVSWSPDSTRFIVMRTERAPRREVHIIESTPDDRTPDTLQPELVTFNYTKPGDAIDQPRPVLFDALNATKVEIDNSPIGDTWSVNRIEWAPDSSAFYYLYNQRGHQVLRVVRVDASTGESRIIVEEKSDTFINYSNKTYMKFLHDRDEMIWMSERSGWNHLYRVNTRSGRLVNTITSHIAGGDWVVRSVEDFDEPSGTMLLRIMGYHSSQDPYHIHYARVKIDGSGFLPLTQGDGTHTIEFSEDGRYYTDRYSRVDLAPVTELRRSTDGSLVATLGEGDLDALVDAGWSAPERFVAKGRDGETDIWGFIQKPSNFDANKTYPVIESIYAGPHGQHVPKSFSVWRGSRSLGELGFITVHIDGMGTNWRSKAFHDVAWKNIADAGFPDRIAWMRAAGETRPWMDLERVGIYGVSAGGQNAMAALLWHNDFYKAAVADCGCHDNRMDKIWWNEAWMGYPIDESYSFSSNRDNAHLLEGDLLLTVGELDRNVDPASTMQVVDTLIRADKDFEFIVFPGLGHGTIGSAYGRRRMRDFFVRSLLGVEPRGE